jgi:hypothetical protein
VGLEMHTGDAAGSADDRPQVDPPLHSKYTNSI